MKALVHIGHPKTGTTSLQGFLEANREALSRQGYFYRRYSRSIAQPELMLAAIHKPGQVVGEWLLRTPLGIETPQDEIRVLTEFEDRLAADQQTPGIHTMIFSCEHLGGMVQADPRGAVGLHNWLDARFDEIELVYYIRRQDKLKESQYSEFLRHGGTMSFAQFISKRPPVNFNRLVHRWEKAFGADKVTVRIFEKGALAEGDIVDDFCALAGIDRTGLRSVPRLNESFTAWQAEFVRRTNALVPSSLRKQQIGYDIRQRQVKVARRLIRGGPTRPAMSDEMRADVLRKAEQSNEALRARRFPDRPRLFDA